MRELHDKVLGALYGMAIGDAIGMPPELWSRARLLKEYGQITDFLDGHPENEISHQYKRGNITDDTSQALAILDSLIETDFRPDEKSIARHLLKWAKKEDAFKKNILGPTSKIVFKLLEKGEDSKPYASVALTNGSAMRIPPIGTLFLTSQKKELCDYVAAVSRVTHSSDIAIAGASMIAMAVASIIEFGNRQKMVEDALSVESYALSLGAETASPSLVKRTEYALKLADQYKGNGYAFLDELYKMMGAGTNVVDSIPCAIAIAYYSFDVKQCALLCANLGGDTDTIGAMATSICGAMRGISGIDEKDIMLINKANNLDLVPYADAIMKMRGELV